MYDLLSTYSQSHLIFEPSEVEVEIGTFHTILTPAGQLGNNTTCLGLNQHTQGNQESNKLNLESI